MMPLHYVRRCLYANKQLNILALHLYIFTFSVMSWSLGCSSPVTESSDSIQDVVCCWSYPCDGKNASAGNRTRVTSMATMYSTTRPLMLLAQFWHRVCIIVFVLSVVFQDDLRLEQKSSSGAQKSKPPDAMRNRHLMGFQGDCVIYAAS